MNALLENQAERLNRDCDCTFTDLQVLRHHVDVDAETHAHLFATSPVFLEAAQERAMHAVVEAVHAVVQTPAYEQLVLGRAPPIARLPQKVPGVFTGFDFHLAEDGPKLIEINTNAGGAFVNIAARAAQRACCDGAEGLVQELPTVHSLEDGVLGMFHEEWRLARGSRPLISIAIVDENPEGQFLYPEFRLAAQLFASRGISARIADPSELEIRDGRLLARGDAVDLVYNRLTDFYFEDPRHQVLRRALFDDLAVITPHPRAHALYADKQNLVLLSDPPLLRSLGVPDEYVETLARAVPLTREVTSDAERWWRERKSWFFKPRHGFGSRGAYRGDKLTRRVFGDVVGGGYIAQALVPPSERWRATDTDRKAFKVDVRCYTHAEKVLLMAARLYQGQTTNFRTAGGGFAPVYVMDAPGPI